MMRLGIYVQVPFCQTKCTYCNFHTGVVSTARFAPYVSCVCSEIAGHRGLYEAAGIALPAGIADAAVDTIYIGGGTPSLLDPEHLGRIVGAVRENFACELSAVTLEADPETVTEEKAAAWVAVGINRVSFGVQSFSDDELKAAGRMHRRADVYRAAAFYETACSVLEAAGYEHYEISNWAKPGFASRHNLKYWRREPYLGFGAGAHSFSGTERWANAHDAADYVNAVAAGRLPVEQHEKLTAEGALEEELFLGLRQLEGIDVARIEREYGVSLDARFARLSSAGLIEREGSLVRLAPGRVSVSNEVFVELMK